MLEHARLLELISTLTRAEVAALVAAELEAVDAGEADHLGATFEVRANLETSGLLQRSNAAHGSTRWSVTPLGSACAKAVCPKCLTPMSAGKALVGPLPGITYEGEWPVEYRDCVKCHSCGHSERKAFGGDRIDNRRC